LSSRLKNRSLHPQKTLLEQYEKSQEFQKIYHSLRVHLQTPKIKICIILLLKGKWRGEGGDCA